MNRGFIQVFFNNKKANQNNLNNEKSD